MTNIISYLQLQNQVDLKSHCELPVKVTNIRFTSDIRADQSMHPSHLNTFFSILYAQLHTHTPLGQWMQGPNVRFVHLTANCVAVIVVSTQILHCSAATK